MQAFRTYSQRFVPDARLLSWMDLFRQMVNDFVRIGDQTGAKSYDALTEAASVRMREYDLDPSYKASAVSRAIRILALHRSQVESNGQKALPFCRKPMLACFKGIFLRGPILRIPVGVDLHLNRYMTATLSGYLSPRLVVLTPEMIHVTVSRFGWTQRIGGMAGIDVNTDNLTLADSYGKIIRYDLSKIFDIVEKCLKAKRGLHRKDARIRKALFRKYGQIERNRVGSIVHNATSRIVAHASMNGLGLAIEEIRGLRRLYVAKAGHTAGYLRKRHAWPYLEIQRQLSYKASWSGIPLVIVSPEYTSSECFECRGNVQVSPNDSKLVWCSSCGVERDRDENAARNILRRGLRSGLVGSAGEAMKMEKVDAKPSDSRVDADQPAGPPGRQDHR